MKILHINSYDGNGGAARATQRLSDSLNNFGVESSIAVNFKKDKDSTTKAFQSSTLGRAYSFFLLAIDQLLARLFVKKAGIPFSTPFVGKSIANNHLVREADILHLHWINQGFLTPESIKELISINKPIVWTFHDCNAFTGGCHVRYQCENYKQECGNCPVMKDSKPNDLSHKIWLRKKKAYSNNNFYIISPSNWLARGVKESSLLRAATIAVIPNTVPIDVFKPTPKHIARELLGWDNDKFIMLSGYMPSKTDKHKGADYLIESLKLLISKVDPKQIALATFGNSNSENIIEGLDVINVGRISDDNILALVYSAADIFLTTTLDDNLPNTVMESLACGTPVISFTTGGIPDMVTHKHNGYLSEYKSSEDFYKGILWAFNHPNRKLLSQNARQTVELKFSPEVVAKQHLELYKQILSND